VQRSTTTTPDEHLASLPDQVRADLQALDAAISREMAGEERVLWEGRFWGGSEQRIIGYGAYAYTGSSKKPVEWFVVGLAAQKNYITVFVNAVEGGGYLAERHADRLGKAKIGRSSISFKRLADIDLGVLLELVRRAQQVMTTP
jgi:Domain of unknown function (DU1801)